MFHRLLVEKDVPIQLRDGGTVVSDVFRPAEAGHFPVIITLGPYPKDIPFGRWQPAAWALMPEKGEHMHWETVDPDWWVPQGYAVVRCDTRGTGKSEGRPRLLSRQEAEDFYDCIDWAGGQEWSSGKVAVMGVSYFAMKLDTARSTPYRPYHSHDEIKKVTPFEPIAVEIEILPTSAVFERGNRLVLEVGADDDPRILFQHDDPRDRIPRSKCTIHTGGTFDSHLLLPIIPA